MIIKFNHILLTGKPCTINEDFKPAMELFCRYLEIVGCSALVNSAYREDSKSIKGAIVTPSKISNHFVGHAIDCNIYDKSNTIWTSNMLEIFVKESPKYNATTNNEVLQLINLVRRSTSLRWGGDFHAWDTVHFDDGMNIHNMNKWNEIYKELHANPIKDVPGKASS